METVSGGKDDGRGCCWARRGLPGAAAGLEPSCWLSGERTSPSMQVMELPPTQTLAVGVLRDAHTSGAAQAFALGHHVLAGRQPSGISHCARLALRLPVTGSSWLPGGAAKHALPRRARWCRWRWGPCTTPTSWPRSLRRAWSGCRWHGVGTVEQQAQPPRAVVQQLRSLDLPGAQAQRTGHQCQQGGLGALRCMGGAAKARVSPWRRMRTSPWADSCTMVSGRAAGGPPAARRGSCPAWVAEQRAARRRGEDAHPVVSTGCAAFVGRGQQKGGFRQVGPGGKPLHGLLGRPLPSAMTARGCRHRAVAEDVDLFVQTLAHEGASRSRALPSAGMRWPGWPPPARQCRC